KQGDDFLRKYNDMFDNPTEMDEILKKKILESITMNKKTLLDFKKIKPYLDKGFESSLWKDMSKRCITCGICTYLCPTCQCFDIHDETGKDWGPVRFRTWDTCMSPDFTRMAGGHNPREKKVSRIRQRFMHKFKYYFDYFSIPDCTGCGRCIQFCPVNIDVFELLQKLEKQGDKIQ
ncbi:4Fe-4S dicluster domain-containing protein, partial [Candidatus Desantisbacteria bacterium]|nr:4Fe-4S dicluster domain-containing protein [Candidatus Desantisbacteria bacterium]